MNGHYIFNLQHDGVAAGLAPGTSGANAAMELSFIETAALGGIDMKVTAQHAGQEPAPSWRWHWRIRPGWTGTRAHVGMGKMLALQKQCQRR